MSKIAFWITHENKKELMDGCCVWTMFNNSYMYDINDKIVNASDMFVVL